MHQMFRLDNEILYAVINSPCKSLVDIIYLLSVSCVYMVNDDLSCEGSSY